MAAPDHEPTSEHDRRRGTSPSHPSTEETTFFTENTSGLAYADIDDAQDDTYDPADHSDTSTVAYRRTPTTGELQLDERSSLQRVPGLSTELTDITEVEYRQLRLERVVLVGVWTRSGHLHRLGQGARTARGRPRDRSRHRHLRR